MAKIREKSCRNALKQVTEALKPLRALSTKMANGTIPDGEVILMDVDEIIQDLKDFRKILHEAINEFYPE